MKINLYKLAFWIPAGLVMALGLVTILQYFLGNIDYPTYDYYMQKFMVGVIFVLTVKHVAFGDFNENK